MSWIANLQQMMQTHERFEFFWQPRQDPGIGQDHGRDRMMHQNTRSPKKASDAAGTMRSCRTIDPILHTEMEYSVAAADGPACFAEIRDLLMNTFTEVQWPVEYRTVARDDAWLSNAYGRETVTISVHQDVRVDESDYYAACESIFKAYRRATSLGQGALSRWRDTLASLYPRWRDWWRVRDDLDPRGIFMNEFLAPRCRPSKVAPTWQRKPD